MLNHFLSAWPYSHFTENPSLENIVKNGAGMSDREFTRRDALKPAGGAVAGVGVTDIAAADDAAVRINVGYNSAIGRAAADCAAAAVIYEFAVDALTIEAPESTLDTLLNTPGIRNAEREGKMYALNQTLPWVIARVDAEVAHANDVTGNGVDIPIIDTGIDSDQLTLQTISGKTSLSSQA